jgi:transposase
MIRRPKYACRACEDVVLEAPAPPRLIVGGIPAEATVDQVSVSKYADHLWLYPQAQINGSAGRQSQSIDATGWAAPPSFCDRSTSGRSPS